MLTASQFTAWAMPLLWCCLRPCSSWVPVPCLPASDPSEGQSVLLPPLPGLRRQWGQLNCCSQRLKLLSPLPLQFRLWARVFPRPHEKGLKIRPSEQRSTVPSSRKPSKDQLEVFLPYVTPLPTDFHCAPPRVSLPHYYRSCNPSHFCEAFPKFSHIHDSLTPQVRWVMATAVVVTMVTRAANPYGARPMCRHSSKCSTCIHSCTLCR